MALQKTFTKAYANQLRESVADNLAKYAGEAFPIDPKQILVIPNIDHPVGLCDKMLRAQNDGEAAKALYEAYRHLTPVQASQEAFWIYLAHTELFPYVQKRWPKVREEGDNVEYIMHHWFFGRGIMRNALGNLWWSVYCTIDDENTADRYKYTDFFMSFYTIRADWLGQSKLLRHKDGLLGVLQFLIEIKDNPANNLSDKIGFVTSYFNRMGATKQLAYLDRQFFYKELKSVQADVLSYHYERPRGEVDEDELPTMLRVEEPSAVYHTAAMAKEPAAQVTKASKGGKMRKIRVRFPDGSEVCCKRVIDTLAAVVKYAGPAEMIRAEICVRENGGQPLVATQHSEVSPPNICEPLGDGYFLNTNYNTNQKIEQIGRINRVLNLGLVVTLE